MLPNGTICSNATRHPESNDNMADADTSDSKELRRFRDVGASICSRVADVTGRKESPLLDSFFGAIIGSGHLKDCGRNDKAETPERVGD